MVVGERVPSAYRYAQCEPSKEAIALILLGERPLAFGTMPSRFVVVGAGAPAAFITPLAIIQYSAWPKPQPAPLHWNGNILIPCELLRQTLTPGTTFANKT